MKRLMISLITVVACFSFAKALAVDTSETVLSQWYKALGAPVDVKAVTELLAEEAIIDLRDLDLKQTKAEFLGSLDAWSDVIKGGTISHTITDDLDGVVEVAVCYKFASSQLGTTETFQFTNAGKIVGSVQEENAASCS